MKPYPYGYFSDPKHECRCTFHQIQRYLSKISGPLLDRIDLHVDVPAVPYRELKGVLESEPSESIRQRVADARAIQSHRFGHTHIYCNAQMNSRLIKRHCQINNACHDLLETAIDKLGLSARAHSRILKIARTIADIEGADDLKQHHIAEAVQYRDLDRGSLA